MSAIAGSDYAAISTHLMFPTGSVSGDMKCINITIIDDVVLEEDETLTVAMTNTSPYNYVAVEDDELTLTIRDNDR